MATMQSSKKKHVLCMCLGSCLRCLSCDGAILWQEVNAVYQSIQLSESSCNHQLSQQLPKKVRQEWLISQANSSTQLDLFPVRTLAHTPHGESYESNTSKSMNLWGVLKKKFVFLVSWRGSSSAIDFMDLIPTKKKKHSFEKATR